MLNGSDADNVLDGSNASSWASDIVSAIDEHEKGIPDVDDKFLSESFEQPKLVGQQTDHLLDPEGHTDSKYSELDIEHANIQHDTGQRSSVSDNLYVRPLNDVNDSTELTTAPDTELSDLSIEDLESLLVEPDEGGNQYRSHETHNDFVNTLDVDAQSDWDLSLIHI